MTNKSKAREKKIKVEWEEKFDRRFTPNSIENIASFYPEEVKSFIRSLLKEATQRAREEERRRLKEVYLKGGNPWKVIDDLIPVKSQPKGE